MVDAGFTTAPRQRNTLDENKKVKDGEEDDLWNDKPHKKRQKTLTHVGRKNRILELAIKL